MQKGGRCFFCWRRHNTHEATTTTTTSNAQEQEHDYQENGRSKSPA
ncbi:MAG TPA: hypothetical protein VFH28_02865 [Nitrososphaera sp.]|nr:hypothetical protein [Nitrososphaera sp.]